MIPIGLQDYPYLQSMPPMTALPSAQSLIVDPDCYYEVQRLVAQDDARGLNTPGSAFAVQILENENTNFFSDFVQTDLLFWTGGNPGRLATPIILSPNTSLRINAKDTGLAGAYTRLDLAFEGIKRYSMTPQQYAQLRQRPYYAYVSPPNQDIVNGAPLSFEIKIQGDAAFVVQNLLGVGIFNNASGSASEFAGVRVQITNISDSERRFYSKPAGWFQVFGQRDVWLGGNRLTSPMVFRKNDVIRVDITTDTDEATPQNFKNVQVAFEGYKVKG